MKFSTLTPPSKRNLADPRATSAPMKNLRKLGRDLLPDRGAADELVRERAGASGPADRRQHHSEHQPPPPNRHARPPGPDGGYRRTGEGGQRGYARHVVTGLLDKCVRCECQSLANRQRQRPDDSCALAESNIRSLTLPAHRVRFARMATARPKRGTLLDIPPVIHLSQTHPQPAVADVAGEVHRLWQARFCRAGSSRA